MVKHAYLLAHYQLVVESRMVSLTAAETVSAAPVKVWQLACRATDVLSVKKSYEGILM